MKRAPSYKNEPSAINPEAVGLWRLVVKKYADDIYESKSMRDQWRKAKSHFERHCAKQGVVPYATLSSLVTRLEQIARRL